MSNFLGGGGTGGAAFSAGVSTGGNTVGTTGTVANELVLAGGNNITLSQSSDASGATVTISAFNAPAQTVQAESISLAGNTVGTSTITGSQIYLAGGNNITLSGNGATITISGPNTVAQSIQTWNVLSASGNTAGTLTSFSTGTMVFAGGNNITLSQSSNTITISGAAAAGDGINVVSASGNTTGTLSTQSSGTMVLAGGNAITLSQSSNTITISGKADSSNILSASGNTAGTLTSFSSGTMVLAGGNNITLSQSSNTITISGPNTVAQSIQTWNVVSASGNTSGTLTSFSTGTMVFAGGNNITLSQSSNTITISGPNTAAQSAQSGGIYATDNTIGTSSSSTYDARSLSIDFGGIISGGWSSNSKLLISATTSQSNQTLAIYAEDPGAGGHVLGTSSSTYDARSLSIEFGGIVSGGWSSSSLVISAAQTNQTLGLYASSGTYDTSSTTVDARSLTIVGQGVLSVGMSAGSLMLSAPAAAGDGINVISASGNTAGTLSTQSSGTMVFAGGTNITLSQSSNTITILAPGVMSRFHNLAASVFAQDQQSNTIYTLAPFQLPYPLDFSDIKVLVSFAGQTTSNTSSGGMMNSVSVVLYTRNGSTLSSINSGSQTYSDFYQSNSTATHNLGHQLTVPFASSTRLSPGDYFLGLYISTATSGQFSLGQSLSVVHLVGTAHSSVFNAPPYGQASNNSLQFIEFCGCATHGGTKASVAYGDLIGGLSGPVGMFLFELRNWSMFT